MVDGAINVIPPLFQKQILKSAIGNMTETSKVTYQERFCQARHSDDDAFIIILLADVVSPGWRGFPLYRSGLAEAGRVRRPARPEARVQVPG
jgi:hypothetical protein